jgi:low temperature requirement protein LtrA
MTAGTASPRGLIGRDPEERHRAATPLELLFDLVFVVAIAAAAAGLHHAIAEGHALEGAAKYAVIFLAIWWPWLNFSWFASAFDNDDALYRVLVFLIMAGLLVLTAGIEGMYETFVLTFGVSGYVVMRFAMVALWLRAAHDCPALRRTALAYAGGIALCQLGWTMLVFVGGAHLGVTAFYALFAGLWLLEFLVPAVAERRGGTPWHAHHIVERYGLMTIIVLGEGVLSSSLAVRAALREDEIAAGLTATVGGALIILFAMWWLYFHERAFERIKTLRGAFLWGYLHYFIFASAAAVGAGVAAAVDVATRHAEASLRTTALAVALPVAVYLMAIWFVHDGRQAGGLAALRLPFAALAAVAAAFAPQPILAIGAVLAASAALGEMKGRTSP